MMLFQKDTTKREEIKGNIEGDRKSPERSLFGFCGLFLVIDE